MKIDAHQHFWNYDPIRDSWIDEQMGVLKNDFLPDTLKKEMDQCGIDGCIAIQADQSEEETEFLLDLAVQNPFIKGVVGWVDLQAEDIEERLSVLSQNNLLKGIRHIVQSESDHFMQKEEFKRGISALSKFNLTYDILIFPKHLGSALELVNEFPEQPFVLDHIAKPQIKAGLFTPWREQIQELAKAANVYCKASGLITEADWLSWHPNHIYPYLDIVFEAFGTNRIMFGSDWPVCMLAGGYEISYELITLYLESFSEQDERKVLGLNAQNFYKLE